MTRERVEELRKIIATAEEKGWTMDVAVAREMIDAIAEMNEQLGVVYMVNYRMNTDEPDSFYRSRDKAEEHANSLSGYEVQAWEVEP